MRLLTELMFAYYIAYIQIYRSYTSRKQLGLFFLTKWYFLNWVLNCSLRFLIEAKACILFSMYTNLKIKYMHEIIRLIFCDYRWYFIKLGSLMCYECFLTEGKVSMLFSAYTNL